MIGRFATWIFYAVFFFLVGVWTGPHLPAFDGVLGSMADWGYRGIARIQEWALSDDGKAAVETPVETPAAVPGELETAREAYARGDIGAAIAAYEEFLRQSPDDIDARGELGNVFFAAERFADAARAYYEVAVVLLKRGEADKARALEPAIRRGDPMLADELVKALATNAAPATGAMTMPAGQDVVRVAVR